MDLGIKGKWGLVCAASKGLGKGCAHALVREGVNVVITARGADSLYAAADELRALNPSVQIKPVIGDITTPAGRQAALEACPQIDILVTNAGGPPVGDFRNWDRDTWINALDANMLAPIDLIRAVLDDMLQRRFGRIVNITSAAVKAPVDGFGLSTSPRLGLTGFVAGLARTAISRNVTINNLLPSAIDTARLAVTAQLAATARGVTSEQILQERASKHPAGRFGTTQEFGEACAFLCGTQAGFITGQNILIDGGAFPGTF